MVGAIGMGAIAEAGGWTITGSGTRVLETRGRGKSSYLEAEKDSGQKDREQLHDEGVGRKLVVEWKEREKERRRVRAEFL